MAEQNMLTYAQYYNMCTDEFKTNDAVAVKVVAMIGWGQSWAAYAGLSTWTDAEIAEGGDKIDRTAAERLFPTIAAGFNWRV